MRLIFPLSFTVSLLFFSCKFKQFQQSEKDLQKHYQKTGIRPVYHQAEILGRSLFFAELPGPENAPLLFMIHGSPGAWYGYLKQMDDPILRNHFSMISIDRPGFGNSAAGTSLPSITAQAEMIAEVIRNEKKHRKVILLGRSYGSPIAAVIAAKYPELADGLLLVSSAADPDAEKYFSASGLAHPSCLFHGCVPIPMRMAYDEKNAHASELRKIIYIWKEIHQPVVILQAKDDKIVYPKNGLFLDSALVNASHRLIMVPYGGHLITWSHPDLVREELLKLRGLLK